MKKEDIGRSHVIGKHKDGKSQVIVRFLSYRVREKVYNSKKELKRHPDKIFITENLTQYRTNLVKALAELKYSRKIHAYWTTDGTWDRPISSFFMSVILRLFLAYI
jgi:hypothetical protein